MISERKLKILEAIVRGYVSTAEPVGSRTIEKRHNIGFSSATIRNEMSDLEEMGLILKPHTSAGSIPSEKGYRIFVDEILNYENDEQGQLDFLSQVINKNLEHIDFLMEQTAKMVSDVTNGITVISEPQSNNVAIQNITFIPVDSNSFAIVIITCDKKVSSKVVQVDSQTNLIFEDLQNLGSIFTREFTGLKLKDITNERYSYLKEILTIDEVLLESIIRSIVEILSERNNYKVYTYGKENLFRLPEFGDAKKAVEIIKTLDEQQMLISILGKPDENIQVVIGSENQIEQMRDCSIVRKSYSLGNDNVGCIGVIGPTRMEYEKTINALNYVVECFKNIDKKF